MTRSAGERLALFAMLLDDDGRLEAEVATPATLAADADDLDPGTASVLRLTTDTSGRTVNGIAGGWPGRQILVVNANTVDAILFAPEALTSTDTDRLLLPGTASLEPGLAMRIWYDAVDLRWRVISGYVQAIL